MDLTEDSPFNCWFCYYSCIEGSTDYSEITLVSIYREFDCKLGKVLAQYRHVYWDWWSDVGPPSCRRWRLAPLVRPRPAGQTSEGPPSAADVGPLVLPTLGRCRTDLVVLSGYIVGRDFSTV